MKNKSNEKQIPIALAPPVTRPEVAFIAIVAMAGTVLRCALLSRAAVEHFDEGVYASNFWFAGAGGNGVYPFQHLYAPPLLPTLVDWSINMLGSGHLGTMFVNLFFGSATIVLAWWVARSMFGIPAAAATAVLAATSDFHVLYSRTVLTDPLLCFWMLAAVYLAWEALRRQCLGWATMAAVATAAAWWSKYNGWLPLAISLAGLIPWLVFQRPANVSPLKALGLWLSIAIAAFVLWLPVPYGFADEGGYAAVQANHRGYVVGMDGWLESFKRHVASQRHFEGWLSVGGIFLACLAAAGFDSSAENSTWNWRRPRTIAWLPVALAIVAWVLLVGASLTLGLMTIVGLSVALWMARHERSRKGRDTDRALAYWMTLAWVVGLVAVTPLYRAYPRLVLPSLMASWLGAGAVMGRLFDVFNRRWNRAETAATSKPSGRLLLTYAFVGVGVICTLVFSRRLHSRGIPGWENRTGLESIAGQIASNAQARTPAAGAGRLQNVFFVFGEPALVYHLSALGQTAVPIGDLSVLRSSQPPGIVPYLVAGQHALQTPAFVDELKGQLDRVDPIAIYEYSPSDLVLLDEHPADIVEFPTFDRRQDVRLFRVK